MKELEQRGGQEAKPKAPEPRRVSSPSDPPPVGEPVGERPEQVVGLWLPGTRMVLQGGVMANGFTVQGWQQEWGWVELGRPEFPVMILEAGQVAVSDAAPPREERTGRYL